MRTWTLCLALSVAGAAAVTMTATNAHAEDNAEQAHGLFARGVELYREGAYEAALVHFRRAYETSPNPRVLYNIGQAALMLRDYATALRAFERYLEGAPVPEARRAQVADEIKRLEQRVGRVFIKTSLTDADVLVDEAPVARLPTNEPILVSFGRRRISVVPRVGQPMSRVFEVAGGESITFEANPEPARASAASGAVSPASAASAPTSAAPPVEPPSKTGAYVAAGIAGALAAGAGVSFGLALSARGDLEDEKKRFPADAQRVADARGHLETTAIMADVLGVGALVAGGVATYLFLRRGDSARVEATGFPGRAGLRVRF